MMLLNSFKLRIGERIPIETIWRKKNQMTGEVCPDYERTKKKRA